MKGEQHVATSNELKIAKTLSQKRACIFLESRAYIRQSLATLFKLNPLEIPVIANPGEPPKLPDKMGNISVSHCKDAFVVVWHKEKIGIDIERIDRDFDHQLLAKKYFFQNNKYTNNIKFNKSEVLDQWIAIEAAIKWDHGKLAKDIKEWQFFKEESQLFHKKKKLYLKFYRITFYEWNITLAFKEDILPSPIICCEKDF